MDEPEPRMTRHLESRYTQVSDMAVALYRAVEESGLRIPARRDIARHALVSEATISRRFRGYGGDEKLVVRLVNARRHTQPPGWREDGWARWLPADDAHLSDVRIWLSCLALAAHSSAVSEVVRDAWEGELDVLLRDLKQADPTVGAELVQVVVAGLSIRRVLDSELTHERALALLEHAVAALT